MSQTLKYEIEQRAVNENPIIQMLLSKYNNLIVNELKVNNIAMFVQRDDSWECLFTEGFCHDKAEQINVVDDLLPMKEITYVIGIDDPFVKTKLQNLHLEVVIPVFSQSVPTAYLLFSRNIEKGETEKHEDINPFIINMLAQSISDIILACIESLRLITEGLRREAIKKELELAAHVQSRLIPSLAELPRNRHLAMNAFYKPHHEVGGDYYDHIQLKQNKVGFCVADVSGKGIAASLLMSNFQATLRALFTSEIPMHQLVEILNERVLSNAQGHEFITLFIARYDCSTCQLEYVNNGHTTSILYGTKSGNLQLLGSCCPGLGMLDELPAFEVKTIEIEEHSIMLNYTDGLIEMLSDGDNDVLLVFDSIVQHIREAHTIDEAIENIIKQQKLDTPNHNLFDDITLLGVEFYAK